MDNRTLKFTGLTSPITKDKLQQLTSNIGEVESISVADGSAEVRFKTADRAQAASKELIGQVGSAKIEYFKAVPQNRSFKWTLLLLALGLLYYFFIRSFLFEHIPKDAPLASHEGAHYPRYKLMGNTLHGYVKNVKPKASRKNQRSAEKKVQKPVEKPTEKATTKSSEKKTSQPEPSKKKAGTKAEDTEQQKVVTTKTTTKTTAKTTKKPVELKDKKTDKKSDGKKLKIKIDKLKKK